MAGRTVVARPSAQPGTIRASVEAYGGTLALFQASSRNTIVRTAASIAGAAWKATFLPLRFTGYVDRQPFPYPAHRLGFYVSKARRMGILKGICNRHLMGWDPWLEAKPPLALLLAFKQRYPGKYKNTRTGRWVTLTADLRKYGKDTVRQIIDEMWGDGKFLPLVESGKLRTTALAGSRIQTTAKGSAAKITIKVPFPGPRNPNVGRVIKTVPEWEVRHVARTMARELGNLLSGRSGALATSTVGKGGKRTLDGGMSRLPVMSGPGPSSPFVPMNAGADAAAEG